MGHLQDIGETYWQHLAFAARVSLVLLLTAFVLLVHGLFPSIWKDAASNVVMHLHAIFEARKNGEELPEDCETETGVS